ncbi:hypothetical protein [Candidatus Venteria ishoeyi]|uniref:Uncharacterized protein n=1 Tax=Candidatus Venteria ishoeyi TaxID=1899563 RepID=A0A1H6FBJ2_9GAMM|nr:hypothetical protein [Candidatus Venteria ishoeyi]SEH06699.1 Uncharacterised protein [Candidatus Venteria ishoeyi]
MNTIYAWFYQAMPFILAGLFILGLYAFMRTRKPGNEAMPSSVVTLTGVAGALAALVSMAFSYSFAVSLGDSLFMKLAMVFLFFSWQIAEFTAAFWFGHSLNSLSVSKTIIAMILFLGGVTINWTAGQSFLSGRIDDIESERLRQSDAYQSAQVQRQNAQNKAASLAISPAQYQDAATAVQALESDLNQYNTSQAKNSGGASVGTVQAVVARYGCNGYYSKYCVEQERIKSEIIQHQKTIQQWQAYQAAQSHAQGLAAQPLPSGATDATLPGIRNLSETLGIPVATVKAYFNSLLGAACEVAALAMLWLFGGFVAQIRQDEGQQMPPATVTRPGDPIPAMSSGGRINTDGLIEGHAGECVLNAMATSWLDVNYPDWLDNLNLGALALPVVNDYKPMPNKPMTKGNELSQADKRTVGGTYNCESCGDEFQAKTTWHRFCAACGAERKKGVLRAKAKGNK